MRLDDESAIVLFNVGHRDLTVDGKFIKDFELESESTSIREKSQTILNQFNLFTDRFETPIITPVIQTLKLRVSKIEKIVLFGTNQSLNCKFRHTDTIFCAKIIKKLLTIANPDLKIEVVIYDRDPSSHDDAMAFFDAYFLKQNFSKNVYYLTASGGTPPCNMAMLFQGLAKGKTRVRPLYVSGLDSQVNFLSIGEEFERNAMIHAGLEFVKQYNFQAAERMFQFQSALKSLSGAANRWMHFDFSGALHCLDEIKEPNLKRDLIWCENTVTKLTKNQQAEFIKELVWNLQTYLRTGNLVDALARVYRLYEAILYYMAQRYLKLTIPQGDKTKKEAAFREFTERMTSAPEAMVAFKNARLDPQFSNDSVYLVLREVGSKYQYGDFPSNWDNRWPAIEKLIECLIAFKNVRNDTIVAHSWEGVDKNVFLAIGSRFLELHEKTFERFQEDFSSLLVTGMSMIDIDLNPKQNSIEKFTRIISREMTKYSGCESDPGSMLETSEQTDQ